MKYFLSTDTFDYLTAKEASISTFCDFNINGRLNKKYFDTDSVPEAEFSTWKELRPLCYELIKGKTLPVKMSFILMLPFEKTQKILEENGYGNISQSIDFLINIRYENGQVNLISATNAKTFIPDRSYEKIWDDLFSKEIARYNF